MNGKTHGITRKKAMASLGFVTVRAQEVNTFLRNLKLTTTFAKKKLAKK